MLCNAGSDHEKARLNVTLLPIDGPNYRVGNAIKFACLTDSNTSAYFKDNQLLAECRQKDDFRLGVVPEYHCFLKNLISSRPSFSGCYYCRASNNQTSPRQYSQISENLAFNSSEVDYHEGLHHILDYQ